MQKNEQKNDVIRNTEGIRRSVAAMNENSTIELCKRAKVASKEVAALSADEKTKAIILCADALVSHMDEILSANKKDVDAVVGLMGASMTDRLTLTAERINAMADGMRQVAKLPDPVGRVLLTTERENGLIIEKVSVPLGVVAMIYESRPNVTSDAATLCFKSGNACVLRGGKESYNTSLAIVNVIKDTLEQLGITGDAVNLVSDTSRESAKDLMTATGLVDLLVPRGGAGLIKSVVENAKVPCIQTGTGICHIYVDESADLSMAVNIVNNAKTSRPSVCNAEEVCLVNEKIAEEFLPLLKKKLVDDRREAGVIPVELRLCDKSAEIIGGRYATEQDFDTEFLDYILAVKIVRDTDEAIKHISLHSTGHSESIITGNDESRDKFLKGVDSAAVYVNASTRFTDGGEFGLGCEMGISTQKLHARGPFGIAELCSYKYIIHGNGQIR